MFEYVDLEIVKAVIFLIATLYLLLASTRGKSSVAKYYHAAALLAISSIFIIAYMSEQDNIHNMKVFNQGARLECNTNNNLYSVSKQNVWEIERNYFVKESLMVRADKCEEL